MAAYRRVYDSRHLQVDCQKTGISSGTLRSVMSMGYLYLFSLMCSLGHGLPFATVPRSTQLCIPSGSLNRVPASADVMAGTSVLPGGM